MIFKKYPALHWIWFWFVAGVIEGVIHIYSPISGYYSEEVEVMGNFFWAGLIAIGIVSLLQYVIKKIYHATRKSVKGGRTTLTGW